MKKLALLLSVLSMSAFAQTTSPTTTTSVETGSNNARPVMPCRQTAITMCKVFVPKPMPGPVHGGPKQIIPSVVTVPTASKK